MRVYLSAAALAAAGVITVMAGEKPPESYVKLMKDTNVAGQALRGHVQAKDYDAIAADASTIKKLFADTEAFWAARKTEDAIGFSKTGATASDELAAAAKAEERRGDHGRGESRQRHVHGLPYRTSRAAPGRNVGDQISKDVRK